METPRINITAVRLNSDTAVQFSVYGPGWGYRAVSIPAHVVCEQLGAANTNSRQLSLAFELGKPRVLRAVQKAVAHAAHADMITLQAHDF